MSIEQYGHWKCRREFVPNCVAFLYVIRFPRLDKKYIGIKKVTDKLVRRETTVYNSTVVSKVPNWWYYTSSSPLVNHLLKSEAAEFEILRSFDIWAKKTNKPTCMDEVGVMQYEHKAIERAKERYGDSILNGTTLGSWLSDNSLLTHL